MSGRGTGLMTEWSDAEILMALDLCERLELTRAEAAEELSAEFGTGRQGNSVIGLIARVNKQTDGVACRCHKPQNRDGGMPPQWWRDGLRAQQARSGQVVTPVLTAGSREDRLRRALAYAVQHSDPAARLVGAGDDLAFESDSLIRDGEAAAHYLRIRFIKTDLQLFWIDDLGQGGPLLIALPASLQGPLRSEVKSLPRNMPQLKARVFVRALRAPLPPKPAPAKRRVSALPAPGTSDYVGQRADVVAGIARPGWSPSGDLMILRHKACGTVLSAVAHSLGRGLRDVEARWHRLRVVRGLEAELVAFMAGSGDSYDPPALGVTA